MGRVVLGIFVNEKQYRMSITQQQQQYSFGLISMMYSMPSPNSHSCRGNNGAHDVALAMVCTRCSGLCNGCINICASMGRQVNGAELVWGCLLLSAHLLSTPFFTHCHCGQFSTVHPQVSGKGTLPDCGPKEPLLVELLCRLSSEVQYGMSMSLLTGLCALYRLLPTWGSMLSGFCREVRT